MFLLLDEYINLKDCTHCLWSSGYIRAMNILFIDKLLVQQGFKFISSLVHLKEHLNSFYFTITYC